MVTILFSSLVTQIREVVPKCYYIHKELNVHTPHALTHSHTQTHTHAYINSSVHINGFLSSIYINKFSSP